VSRRSTASSPEGREGFGELGREGAFDGLLDGLLGDQPAGPLRVAEGEADRREVLGPGARDHDPAVVALVEAVRRSGAEEVEAALRVRGPPFVPGELAGLGEDALVGQAGEDFLALAGALARVEGGDHAEGGHHGAGGVVHRDLVEDRFLAASLGVHEAAARLDERVEARVGREFALAAVAGDRAGDDARVDRSQRLVVDAEAFADAVAVVVEDDIGDADEIEEGFAPLRVLEVDGEAALAPVVADEAQSVGAERVAVGRLDLDAIGAPVGEDAGGEGAGDEGAEVEDADARERTGAVPDLGFRISGCRRVGECWLHWRAARRPTRWR
jgi:hypothetical protein